MLILISNSIYIYNYSSTCTCNEHYLTTYVIMYPCIYAPMHLCVYVSIFVWIYVIKYMWIYAHLYLCTYETMYLWNCLYVYVCIYVCKYVCMDVGRYVCMYVAALPNFTCFYSWYCYAESEIVIILLISHCSNHIPKILHSFLSASIALSYISNSSEILISDFGNWVYFHSVLTGSSFILCWKASCW